MEQKLRFEDLPDAVENIQTQLSDLRRILTSDNPKKQITNRPMIIQDAARFLHLSVSSVYRLVSQRKITFHKNAGRLYFMESELIEWVKTGRDL